MFGIVLGCLLGLGLGLACAQGYGLWGCRDIARELKTVRVANLF